MGYYTFFKGKLDIELEQMHLEALNLYLSGRFKRDNIKLSITQNYLEVDDEWIDRGLLEEVIFFINKNGKLNSGYILCYGEDRHDIWEIFIREGNPFIKEHGSAITLYRTQSKFQHIS